MKFVLRDAPAPFRGTRIRRLPNGLCVIVKPDATVPVVALQAWAKCGAINEPPRLYGISHGLEHMVFKGTALRSAGDITRVVESNGGSMNAATQLETTHYYIDIPSRGFEPALEVLADTLINPSFPADELERERLVILEEIHRRDDSPDATLWDEFASQLFRGTPYGIKVIGTKQTVSGLSRADLNDYFHAHYVPSRLTLVVAGDVDEQRTVKKIQSLFGRLPARRPPTEPRFPAAARARPQRRRLKRAVQMAYFATGFRAPGLGHPDAVALDLLADVIGGGVSARFYQRLREEEQILLSVACDYVAFQREGLFAFFGETEPAKLTRAIERLQAEVRRLASDPIRNADLDRAKARIKSEWIYASETPHGQATTLGSLSALDRLPVISSYLGRIDRTTVDDVMNAYRRYLARTDFDLTVVEPAR